MAAGAPFFLRHTPADPVAHGQKIATERASLDTALAGGDIERVLDHAGTLGALLTAAGEEAAGHALLAPLLPKARNHANVEAAAWLVHALATAAQYTGRTGEANALFAEALTRCEAQGWQRLQHFVLHHWGRCLAEQGRFAEARDCFQRSLVIRTALDDARLQASSRHALAELSRLQQRQAPVYAAASPMPSKGPAMPTGTVRLHRVLRAPPEKLYRAFLDADALAKWLPPYGFTCKVQELDARVGGRHRASFTNFTTGGSHSFGGVYRDLVPGQLIRYTDRFDDPNLPGEMVCTVTLKAVSCGTDISIVQEGVPEVIPIEMCYLGWQESLEQLARLVEPNIQD
jgi:uncharacterized protein YndB with AHSA1/START domain